MIEIIIMFVMALLISVKPFINQTFLLDFNIDETMFLKYIIKLIPVFIFIIVKFSFANNKFSFIKKINYKNSSLFILNATIGLFTSYLFFVLLKNFELSRIVPISSPLIIILTMIVDFYINKRKFTKNYYVAIFLIILGIIIIQKNSKKITKLEFL